MALRFQKNGRPQSWQQSLSAQSGVSSLVTAMSQQTSLLSSPALSRREWAAL